MFFFTFKKYLEFNFFLKPSWIRKWWKERGKETPIFSYKWQKSYEFRNGFIERVPHPKRRPEPYDETIANFIQDFVVMCMQYEDSGIVNGDETCWWIINGVLKTICHKGLDHLFFDILWKPNLEIDWFEYNYKTME